MTSCRTAGALAFASRLPAGLRAGPVPVKPDHSALLNLSSNELDHPALDGFFRDLLADWPDPRGISRYPFHPAVRDRVAEFCDIAPDRAVLAPGADDAIRALMWTVAPASGRVVLQSPNYPAYAFHAAAAGAGVVPVDVLRRSADARLDALAAAVAATPGACVVVTEPDPVEGAALGVGRLNALAAHCEAYAALLVVDATYAAFAGIDCVEPARRRQNVLVIRSFSKSHALAGVRAAVVLGAPEAVAALARWRLTNAVSALTLDLLLRVLGEAGFWERVHADVRRWRDQLGERLRSEFPRWAVRPSVANFLLVETGSADEAAAVVVGLGHRRIAVKSFADTPALHACFRVTVPPPTGAAKLIAALRVSAPA